MSNSPEKPYQPSAEEIKKAEEMMTSQQKSDSYYREKGVSEKEFRAERQKFADKLFEHEKLSGEDSDEFIELLKLHMPFFSEEQLIELGKKTFLISQAVADYLIPKIRQLDFNGRLELGRKYNYWRIWNNIVRVPGLSMSEIRQIQMEADNSDVKPWDND